MSDECIHTAAIRDVTPSALGSTDEGRTAGNPSVSRVLLVPGTGRPTKGARVNDSFAPDPVDPPSPYSGRDCVSRASENRGLSHVEPRLRIHLSPAASLRTIGTSAHGPNTRLGSHSVSGGQ
jgi:hypothetical protein